MPLTEVLWKCIIIKNNANLIYQRISCEKGNPRMGI